MSDSTDRNNDMQGYLPGTPWSVEHLSTFTQNLHEQRDMLLHMNCSYFSTPGVPPTLEALKKHVQSLLAVISSLEPPDPTGAEAAVDVLHAPGDTVQERAWKNRAAARRANPLDWLRDMSVPYENNNPTHRMPLKSVMNQVKAGNELLGTQWHCPLETHVPRKKGAPNGLGNGETSEHRGTIDRPYAKHHLLLMHANACLERLDHEYSSTGGLLSILPTETFGSAPPAAPTDEDPNLGDETQEMKDARNSLVGQWLVYTQQLVGRMHELEIAYGNALDALQGEAAIPLQHRSAVGPDMRAPSDGSCTACGSGTGGREIAFPQDKWVLVNSGSDVQGYIHSLLDTAEAELDALERGWEDGGVISDRLKVTPTVHESDAEAYSRGIVTANAMTRFYRMKGQGHGTIFVCPAWAVHPATSGTRDLENRPTVVSVVAPRYPVRASDLEKRYEERLKQYKVYEEDITRRLHRDHRREADLTQLADDNRYKDGLLRSFEAALGSDNAALTAQLNRKEQEHAAAIKTLTNELEDLRKIHADEIKKLQTKAEKNIKYQTTQADHYKKLSELNKKGLDEEKTRSAKKALDLTQELRRVQDEKAVLEDKEAEIQKAYDALIRGI